MTTNANWPGAAGLPALANRAGFARKSIQLPFASGAIPPENDAPEVIWGTGNPNGVVVGDVGDQFIQTDSAIAAMTLWSKSIGNGTSSGWFRNAAATLIDARLFGALGDGGTDDSVAINSACATALPGEAVVCPPTAAGYLVGGSSITVPTGVRLLGGNTRFMAGRWVQGVGLGAATVPGGTMFKITNTLNRVIKLGDNSVVQGITFWYPNQTWNITSLAQSFVVYPATIQLGITSGLQLYNPQVLDCHFLGATVGIEQLDADGIHAVNDLHVENVTGVLTGPLLRVYTASDPIRLRNITLNASYAVTYVSDGQVGGNGVVFRTKIAQGMKVGEFGQVGDIDAVNVCALGTLYFAHFKANMFGGDLNEEGGGRWVNCVADLTQAMFKIERGNNIAMLSVVNSWCTPIFRPNGVAGDAAGQGLLVFSAGISNYRVSLNGVRSWGAAVSTILSAGYSGVMDYHYRAAGALGANVVVLTGGCFYHNHAVGIADANTAGVVVLGIHSDTDVVKDFIHPKDAQFSGGYRQTVDGWYQDNVVANQASVELTRAGGRFRACRAGSVTALCVGATEQRTAGTCTVTIFKNTGLAGAAGSTTGIGVQLNAGNLSRDNTFSAKDVVTFVAGDELYIVVTTDAGWLPVTSDIRAALEIED